MLSLYGIICWCKGFCHRTELDLSLFLLNGTCTVLFGDIFVLSLYGIVCWCKGFCHKTELDLSLFLLNDTCTFLLGDIFVLSLYGIACWCKGFCHRTESDLSIFLLNGTCTFVEVLFSIRQQTMVILRMTRQSSCWNKPKLCKEVSFLIYVRRV